MFEINGLKLHEHMVTEETLIDAIRKEILSMLGSGYSLEKAAKEIASKLSSIALPKIPKIMSVGEVSFKNRCIEEALKGINTQHNRKLYSGSPTTAEVLEYFINKLTEECVNERTKESLKESLKEMFREVEEKEGKSVNAIKVHPKNYDTKILPAVGSELESTTDKDELRKGKRGVLWGADVYVDLQGEVPEDEVIVYHRV